jgi:hypothetical protein
MAIEDTGAMRGPMETAGAALLERLLDRERDRNDRLLEQQGAALGRIDARLTTIETKLQEALTPTQWAKALAGIGLPIAALWLTGSADIARALLPHP